MMLAQSGETYSWLGCKNKCGYYPKSEKKPVLINNKENKKCKCLRTVSVFQLAKTETVYFS
mgnify:CR=1 FL=1